MGVKLRMLILGNSGRILNVVHTGPGWPPNEFCAVAILPRLAVRFTALNTLPRFCEIATSSTPPPYKRRASVRRRSCGETIGGLLCDIGLLALTEV